MSQDVVADLEIILTGNTAPYVGAMERAAVAGDAAATSAERAGRATAAAGTESAAAGARAASGAAAAESGSGRWVKAAERSKTAFKGLGLAAAAIFVGSVYSAVEFEKQMELVHTQAGASQAEVERLKGAVLAMAPAAGIGPTKLAEALFHVESVGYRGADAMKVLKSAADGAKVGNADLDSTTYALTSVMNTFGLKADQAGATMAALNAIVGTGDMRMQDLNGAIGSGFLAAADTFGISLQSAGAALAYLTDRGSKADESATRLKMSFALLGAPTHKAAQLLTAIGIGSQEVHARTSAMETALKKAGLTTLQLSSDLKKPNGLGVALLDLKTHLLNSGLSSEQAAALISKSFGGGRSGAAIMSLYAHLDVLKQKFDAQGVAAKNFGQDVEATHKTAAFAIDALKSSVSTLAVKLGTALLPAFRGIVQVVTDVVAWLGKHTTTASALVGVLGGVMLVALAAYTVSMVAAAAATIAATWPLLAVIAAIGLLVAGFVAAWRSSETFRDTVMTVLKALETGFLGFVYGVLGYLRVFARAWLETIGGVIHAAALVEKALGFGDTIQKADRAFRGLKDSTLQTIRDLQDGIKSRMDAAAKDTAYRSALLGEVAVHALASKLADYVGIAAKYGKSLPDVLKDARLPAGVEAKLLALNAQQGLAAQDAIIRHQADVRALQVQQHLAANTPMTREAAREQGHAVVLGLNETQHGVSIAASLLGRRAVDSVRAHRVPATKAGESLGMGALDGVKSVGGFDVLGRNAGQGYVSGLGDMIQQASNAGANIAAAAMAAVQSAQQSHSPSVLFHSMGRFAGEGYANGLASTHGMIADAAAGMAAAAAGAVDGMVSGASGGGSRPVTARPVTARPSGLPAISLGGGSGGASSSASAPVVIHNHLHVDLDGREIHRSVQTHELQYQGRNPRPSTSRR